MRLRVRQILFNLVGNASQVHPSGRDSGLTLGLAAGG